MQFFFHKFGNKTEMNWGKKTFSLCLHASASKQMFPIAKAMQTCAELDVGDFDERRKVY